MADAFEIVPHRCSRGWLESADAYSAALAFVRGWFDVEGDLVEAVRTQLARASSWRTGMMNLVGRLAPWRLPQLWQSRSRAVREIRFHYDRSNDFYRTFLDRRMVYSCAYFQTPGQTLEEAQLAKLNHIARKLRLAPGERFLDIGCGWGALALQAATGYDALATGCTLSLRQAEFARNEIRRRSLEDRVTVQDRDYRDIAGQFDKIASVGMFEHVGLPRLEKYFRKVYELMAPDGLFLNHGITMPASASPDAQGLFIAQRVFPGGRIVRLADVIHAAERAGLETVDVENLRRHYALTCRAWVERLRTGRDECLKTVDEETWRTWQLYLAGSAVAFSNGGLNLHQVLFSRQGAASAVPMTREYMYEAQRPEEPKPPAPRAVSDKSASTHSTAS
jgi:cyclopropane-fatty-acyl-phospholipid synthase